MKNFIEKNFTIIVLVTKSLALNHKNLGLKTTLFKCGSKEPKGSQRVFEL